MRKNTKKIGLIALTTVFSTCILSACALNFNSEESNLNKPASSETFNDGVYIRPDYAIDGKLDESIWATAPKVQFGNENKEDKEVTFQWHYGENGITAAFTVQDEAICYNSAANFFSELFKLSDCVHLFMDVNNDGQTVAQKDDYKFSFCPDGRMEISKGSGSGYQSSTISCDYQVVVNGKLNNQQEKDTSYIIEFFLPYEKFGIDKDATMGIMLQWSDSQAPVKAPEQYYWYHGTPSTTVIPCLYHPINKDGLAFSAPENWVPSMGVFQADENYDLVADDVSAVAYYTGAKMTNGAGTIEATIDASQSPEMFTSARFSGLLFGVEEVGETEKPAWEGKPYYLLAVSNNENRPQLVLAAVKPNDKKVWNPLASKLISDVYPEWNETRVFDVKVYRNKGWIEVYLKDKDGNYQFMYNAFDVESIDGDYIGVRSNAKGYKVKINAITDDAPEEVNPYEREGMTVYSGLISQASDGFVAKTPQTLATFGSFMQDSGAPKSLQTSLTTIPFRENNTNIKGIILNYDAQTGSRLILDYRHQTGWADNTWKFYIRHFGENGWEDVAYVMDAKPDTKYDFKITPFLTADGKTEIAVEYKTADMQNFQLANYCKGNSWVMTGSEYGVYTEIGEQKFGDFSIVQSSYIGPNDEQYKIVQGSFMRYGDGVKVTAGHSTMLDKSIDLSSQNTYTLKTSYKIAEKMSETDGAIRGILFNYNETDGSYLILDHRQFNGEYRLYVRQYKGVNNGAWEGAATWGVGAVVEVNAWYDFKIHVENLANSTKVIVSYKKQTESYYTNALHVFEFALSGRAVGYYSTTANNMEYGAISLVTETDGYSLKTGAYSVQGDMVQMKATNHSQTLVIDNNVDLSNLSEYTIQTSFEVLEDSSSKVIRGIVFNYSEENGSYFILSYRYESNKWLLAVRYYNGTGWDSTNWGRSICSDKIVPGNSYDIKLTVKNNASSTDFTVSHKKKGDSAWTTEATKNLGVALTGRKVGYNDTITTLGTRFGVISKI